VRLVHAVEEEAIEEMEEEEAAAAEAENRCSFNCSRSVRPLTGPATTWLYPFPEAVFGSSQGA